MPQRQTVKAGYERDRGGPFWIHVPSLGRRTSIRPQHDGSIDLAEAEGAVRALVVMWSGWPADSFDVELVALKKRPLRW